jgi:hypothetical protein
MTPPNDDLQDQFDRHFRGDGPPPDTDDPEAAAYRVVFSVLEEEPEGDLPDDFAEQVADRVGVGTDPAWAWSDLLLLLLVVAGLGATVAFMPSSFLAAFQDAATTLGRAVDTLSSVLRLDVVVAIGLVLALTAGFDRLLEGWIPRRRVPSVSS